MHRAPDFDGTYDDPSEAIPHCEDHGILEPCKVCKEDIRADMMRDRLKDERATREN